MEYTDKIWKPVDYLLKLLNKTEWNYGIHNKEMLVVIRGLKTWRCLLKNAKFKFEVWIYHKDLKHVLGLRVEKSDRLSKRLNLKIVVENNNNK